MQCDLFALLIAKMLTEILIVIAGILFGLFVWQYRTYTFWRRRNVKHITPKYLLGNCSDLLSGNMSLGEQIFVWHKTEEFANEPVVGVYLVQRPGLLLRDLNLIKMVLTKKFPLFSNRTLQTDRENDPLAIHNIFFARTLEWQALRTKLLPVFTITKLKDMYPLMVKIGKNLETKLRSNSSGTIMPIKDICARFTTDVIGSIAFGLDVKALNNENSEFYTQTRAFSDVTVKRAFDFAMMSLLPSMTQFASTKVFSENTTEFLRTTVEEKLEERQNLKEPRPDLIDSLLEMLQDANSKPFEPNLAFDLDYLAAQAALFQSNALGTCATTITFALYELALQPAVQARLRTEIQKYFARDEHITYERIQEMPYLTQVVNETLRKYPPHPYLERECSPPQLPGGERVSLAPYFNFVVPNGMPLYISILGIHRDAKYWHDPERFNPDRFASVNKSKIVPDSYMPFGLGPRNCMGMRLAFLVTKLGIAHFLRNHRVSRCNKTVNRIEFEPLTPMLCARDEIFLKLERV